MYTASMSTWHLSLHASIESFALATWEIQTPLLPADQSFRDADDEAQDWAASQRQRDTVYPRQVDLEWMLYSKCATKRRFRPMFSLLMPPCELLPCENDLTPTSTYIRKQTPRRYAVMQWSNARRTVTPFYECVNNPRVEFRRLLAGKCDVYRQIIGQNVNQITVSVFVQKRYVLELCCFEIGRRDVRNG